MAKTGMGRPSIFKKDGPDVHGRISKSVEASLEVQRKKLAKVYLAATGDEWRGKISDGDVIEFLLRGEASSRLYWKGQI